MPDKDRYLHLRHNKTLLMAHIIFVTKYRKVLKTNRKWDRIIHELNKGCGEIQVRLIKVEADKDHIHMLIQYPPSKSISNIVRHLKQVSTYRMWRCYGNYLKKLYWHEKTLWSDGYFAASIGNASKETIIRYIENQG